MSNGYFHPSDINLTNLHKAMQYDELGRPELRTTARVENASYTFGGTVSVDNLPATQEVSIADGPSLSAFSRQRTTSTKLLGEFRTFYGTTGNLEIINSTIGTASISSNLTAKFTSMSVGTTNGDRAVRQTRQYYPYIPGTSQLGLITFCFGGAKANLRQGVGLYDDNDGIFFMLNGLTPTFVIRKSGIDNETAVQSSWNVDPMDGTGPSGINLDFTKAQILVIDYQWLGVGRVRFGFDVDGQIYYAHYFSHANSVTEPYNAQPSLPVRWEIRNTGTVASSSSMKAICSSVYCEGEDYETGFLNSASTGTTGVSVNASPAGFGVLAVRLKNTVNGIPVKAFARLKGWNVLTSNDVFYRIMVLPDSTAMSGSPSWSSATPLGWCEYTTNFTLASDPPPSSLILYQGYAAGNNGNSGQVGALGTESRSASIFQNLNSTDSMIFAIVAYKLANNASVHASMAWLEVK